MQMQKQFCDAAELLCNMVKSVSIIFNQSNHHGGPHTQNWNHAEE